MKIFWIILISLFAFCLLLSFFLYLIIFFRGKKKTPPPEPIRGKDFDPYAEQMRGVIKAAVSIPFEKVTVRSREGILLYGRLYVTRPGRPFHLQFNGYRSSGIRDFAGGLRMALDLGDNVLLVDQRAHGQSGGHTISFGVRERFDVLTWCRFLLERFGLGTPLYVEGISMGGATVLFAAGEDLPPEVRGIFADCPFSDPVQIISDVMRKLIGFSRPLLPFVALGALLFGHFRLSSIRATDTVKRTRVPIQIVHGTADNFVPCSM
ncbi:MAG: alpha/beta fold hydrolase, partial [Clostridia bacterium]|nr:alpha/beta fold hydrolase [Clostridia bacterium]